MNYDRGDTILKLEIEIKNIQYSQLMERFTDSDSLGIKIVTSVVKKCPPKLKNEMVIFAVNKKKFELIASINKYARRKHIPVSIYDLELSTINKKGR